MFMGRSCHFHLRVGVILGCSPLPSLDMILPLCIGHEGVDSGTPPNTSWEGKPLVMHDLHLFPQRLPAVTAADATCWLAYQGVGMYNIHGVAQCLPLSHQQWGQVSISRSRSTWVMVGHCDMNSRNTPAGNLRKVNLPDVHYVKRVFRCSYKPDPSEKWIMNQQISFILIDWKTFMYGSMNLMILKESNTRSHWPLQLSYKSLLGKQSRKE